MSDTSPPSDPKRGAPEGPAPEPEPLPADDRGNRRPTALIVALVVAVAVIAGLVTVLITQDDDDTTTSPTTSDTQDTGSSPTTTAPTTSTSTTTTATPTPDDTTAAVFPDPASSQRFDDPSAAADGFAVDFLGFTDPEIGEFMAGDSRSGEVEVRPTPDGPVTTVIVRQLGSDDTWWVLGAATEEIVLDAPTAGATVTSPVALSGRARAFEGTVDVQIRQDGATDPIGTGFVTGAGDVVHPFDGEVEFTAPTAERGAIVLLTTGGEDDRVWRATVVRVQFG